jgi:FtsZ-interacting cell division protein ZipA
VTLTLDVARTREPRASYEAMARAGRQLAQARGGRLVDDTGKELDERSLAAIGRQLDAVRERLAGCGIEPGSPLALRVFS